MALVYLQNETACRTETKRTYDVKPTWRGAGVLAGIAALRQRASCLFVRTTCIGHTQIVEVIFPIARLSTLQACIAALRQRVNEQLQEAQRLGVEQQALQQLGAEQMVAELAAKRLQVPKSSATN